MTDCPLTLVAGRWTCPDCGWVYRLKSEKPPRRNCPEGRPLPDPRTDAEVAACRAVCLTCEHFAGDRCRACHGCKGEAVAVYESTLRAGECPRNLWPARP
jgi:rubredoxin